MVSRSLDAPGVVDVKLPRRPLRELDCRLSLIKFSLTFTDFPSNVCVVPMLAFFVYARFFLPTTRRRRLLGMQSRPTRMLRFRHATTRDDSLSSENETTTTTRRRRRRGTNSSQRREREKREEEEGKKNVTRLFERERKKRVKAFFSCEDTGKKKGHKDDVSKT